MKPKTIVYYFILVSVLCALIFASNSSFFNGDTIISVGVLCDNQTITIPWDDWDSDKDYCEAEK